MLPTHPTYTTCRGHHPHLRPGPPSPVTSSAACLPSRYDLFVLEYSEPQLPETTITLSVAGDPLLNGGPCAISSTHDRAWITPYGPLVPSAGAWHGCVGWATTYDAASFASAFYGSWPVYLGTATDCSSNADIYCFGSSVADSQCVSAPVSGCGYAGSECCRHCDVPGKNRCSFRDEPYADYHPNSSSLPRPSLTFDHLRCAHPLRYTGTVSYASWSCEVNVTGCCGGELGVPRCGKLVEAGDGREVDCCAHLVERPHALPAAALDNLHLKVEEVGGGVAEGLVSPTLLVHA